MEFIADGRLRFMLFKWVLHIYIEGLLYSIALSTTEWIQLTFDGSEFAEIDENHKFFHSDSENHGFFNLDRDKFDCKHEKCWVFVDETQ